MSGPGAVLARCVVGTSLRGPSLRSGRQLRGLGAHGLAGGTGIDMGGPAAALASRKGHRIALPPDLPQDPGELHAHLQQRRGALDTRESSARAALARLDAEHDVPAALGELALAAWVVTHVPELPVTEHFAWITGWCAARDDCGLREALDRQGLHYLLRMTDAPAGTVPPSVLRNPPWARPFETMTGMMGVPAAMFTPLFVIARPGGRNPPVSEQRSDGKMRRPNSYDTGRASRASVPRRRCLARGSSRSDARVSGRAVTVPMIVYMVSPASGSAQRQG